MSHMSNIASFISARIDESNKSASQIAFEAGLETTNDVLMLKTGSKELSIAKVGAVAKTLNTDPVELLTMCLHEYFPETWESISPFLDTVLTDDELSLVKGLRSAVGGPYVTALTPDEREPLDKFLKGLRRSGMVH